MHFGINWWEKTFFSAEIPPTFLTSSIQFFFYIFNGWSHAWSKKELVLSYLIRSSFCSGLSWKWSFDRYFTSILRYLFMTYEIIFNKAPWFPLVQLKVVFSRFHYYSGWRLNIYIYDIVGILRHWLITFLLRSDACLGIVDIGLIN